MGISGSKLIGVGGKEIIRGTIGADDQIPKQEGITEIHGSFFWEEGEEEIPGVVKHGHFLCA